LKSENPKKEGLGRRFERGNGRREVYLCERPVRKVSHGAGKKAKESRRKGQGGGAGLSSKGLFCPKMRGGGGGG